MNWLRKIAAGFSAEQPEYRTAPDTRVYAVGDIHGRLDLLEELLDKIKADIAARPAATIALVFLGDLIDRGPASAQVIERLRTLDDVPARALFLLGNHEEIFLRVLEGEPRVVYDWLGFGGDACVESYGLNPHTLAALDEQEIAAALREAVPPAHLDFLHTFGDSFRSGDYVFVHAGIRPGVPLEEQNPQDLRWIRRSFLADTKAHGFMVVHGHTISEGVEERSNRIGIDTGAYQSGVLTALAVEGAQRWFIATGGERAGGDTLAAAVR